MWIGNEGRFIGPYEGAYYVVIQHHQAEEIPILLKSQYTF
jgi:hypothetical protein